MSMSDSCAGVFVTLNNDLYCSITLQHQVMITSLNVTASSTRVAAGNNTAGSGALMLNQPRGIFVHINFNLYVADCQNNRVQLFQSGQLTGITVVGNTSLQCPWSVILDGAGQLFIASQNNHRIIGYMFNISRCIFGCGGGGGSSSSQLSSPRGISFDDDGNIFVADSGNQRIQKLLLQSNSCGESKHKLFVTFRHYYHVTHA